MGESLVEWGFEERRGDCVERKDFGGTLDLAISKTFASHTKVP